MDGELYLHPVHCDIPAPGGEGWLSHLKEKCSTSIEKENCGYTMFNMRKGHPKKKVTCKKEKKRSPVSKLLHGAEGEGEEVWKG